MLKATRSLFYVPGIGRYFQTYNPQAEITKRHHNDGQGSGRSSPTVKGIDWEKIVQPYTPFQQYASRRSVVYGTKGGSRMLKEITFAKRWHVGMVACSQPLAAEVGLEILRKGGNAGQLLQSQIRRKCHK
jgi:hypothetical protein